MITYDFKVIHILAMRENKITCQKNRTFGKSSLIFIKSFRNRLYTIWTPFGALYDMRWRGHVKLNHSVSNLFQLRLTYFS